MSFVSPLEVVAIGPSQSGARLFRFDGRVHVAAISKLRLKLVPMGTMTAAAPPAIDPVSDAVPFRPGADILFFGAAHTFSSEPVARTSVRLALLSPIVPGGPFSNAVVLVDKTIEVVGPRTATKGWPTVPPSGFTTLSVGYENAYGGPRYEANPAGTGHEADGQGRVRLPCLAYPKDAAAVHEPAGFGPIPPAWLARKRLLAPNVLATVAQPRPELVSNMDFRYFHSAPIDQRTAYLRGDEWLYLEHLSPIAERFFTQLPSLRATAAVRMPRGETQPVRMHIDTLYIDGEAGIVDVIARGSFAIESEADLRWLKLLAGFELGTRGVVVIEEARPAQQQQQRSRDFTMIMEPGAEAADRGDKREGTMILEPPEGPLRERGTMIIEQPAAQASALPFVGARRPPPPAPPPPAPPPPDEEAPPLTVLPSAFENRTLVVERPPPSTSAPFKLARAGTKPRKKAEIPGAPWGPVPSRKPLPASESLVTTSSPDDSFDEEIEELLKKREEETAPPPEEPPKLAVPPPPPAEEKKKDEKKDGKGPWRNFPEDTAPVAVPKKPATPKVTSRSNVKKSLYDRFRKG